MQAANSEFILRSYTKKELRNLYGISKNVFTRWIKSLPELQSSGMKNWLDVVEVKAIITRYGIPGGSIYYVE